MRQPMKINETVHKMGEPTGKPWQTLPNSIWTLVSSLSHLCSYVVWWCLPWFSCGLLSHSVYNLTDFHRLSHLCSICESHAPQSPVHCPILCIISYVQPHSVYSLLRAAPQSPMCCPILCTISYVLPHSVYNLLWAAQFCVQSPMGCPILCTTSYGLPNYVYNLLWAAPFCVQSPMGCPILCTISYGLPHSVYNLLCAAPFCVQSHWFS